VDDSGRTGRGSRALAALGFDPNSVLAREPGVLLDPHFLGALHAELEAEFGSEGAATTLMQIGLIQGLHDAWRAVGDDLGEGIASSPPLAIRFTAVRNAEPAGAIEMVGSWPERSEAGARLSLVGPCSHAACHLSAGYTSGWLSGTMDANILAIETSCTAAGAEECRFVAREADAWRADGDPRAVSLLAALPFDAVRELVRSRPRDDLERAPRGGLDSEAAVVHIWGPVMVIPFTNGDEALSAVELISRDPAAQDVSVVVVDLAGAIIDEAFGALTLEQIIDSAEALGAETIFAAVSPLSEPVVSELDRLPLLIHKDVPHAIAAAFQVASAQRMIV
jgi:predicted hydrocarbon binding protein/anti-anti-sigma regulatory factor